MSKQVFNAAFWFGSYSVRANTNAINLDMAADEVDVSVLSTTSWKDYLPGKSALKQRCAGQ